MLVADSSVWIGFFNKTGAASVEVLKQVLRHGEVRLVVPDLVLFEVLRGFRSERSYRQAKQLMESFDIETSAGHDQAIAAAGHYRSLREKGVTIRGPSDMLIATFCIDRNYALLHDDRDFDAFEIHRGLRGWRQ